MTNFLQEFVASIHLLKGKIFEAMDNRSRATDCYKQALQKSVYCTEALDALVEHEMLMAWEEKELMTHLPFGDQCTPADEKLLRALYESKLKKYTSDTLGPNNPEQTPISGMSANLLKEFTDKMKTTTTLSTSDTKSMNKTGAKFMTPQPAEILSPANKLLNEIRNSPYSIHSSLSKIINDSQNSTRKPKKKVQEDRNTGGKRTSVKLALERLNYSVDVMAAKAEKYFYDCEYRKCTKILEEYVLEFNLTKMS
jgi:anaphase-promoting complex subunit 6